ncbi:MAG: ABC transporter substrate-binding protein [Armatimonadota bacterium]|nr:ABC transporter substrate-binding protein [Armatimonadota bacterium]
MGGLRWGALVGCLVLAMAAGVGAQGQPVSIIEAWFIHNESMGDPVGVEKGFFGPLRVQVIGGGPGLSPIERTMAEAKKGVIAFGVDYPYNILEAREKQKLPLVVVAHDFQKSAVRLLSWKELKGPQDISGTVATWIGYDKQIKAMIGRGWEKQIRIVNQQGDPATIGAWMRKQYQFAHAMGYNEVLVARRLVTEKFYVYSYADDFGMKWPENVVFTTEEIARRYPQIVQQFVTGHYRGFKYALANREEAADILLKYNKNLDRAHEIEGMEFLQSIIVTPATRQKGLGYVDPAAWDQLARDLVNAGIFTALPNVKAAYTTRFPSGVMP